MTSSLVGSEMCIRDRFLAQVANWKRPQTLPERVGSWPRPRTPLPRACSVSYTHLTLPTICSV
eukprot:6804859-Prorocentrum_lima.AAC.1